MGELKGIYFTEEEVKELNEGVKEKNLGVLVKTALWRREYVPLDLIYEAELYSRRH